MAAKGEVDLIIRAKNEATKNLDAINKSLKSLSDQQTIVGDSADKADDKLAQLGLELQKLRTNAQNLKALSTIGDVLNKATEAMIRQRSAADEASQNFGELNAKQEKLAAQSRELATALEASNKALTERETAAKRTASVLSGLGADTADLAKREAELERYLARIPKALADQESGLDKARARQAALTAEIEKSGSATKAQERSLDVANRAIEKHGSALYEAVLKEADYRAELDRLRTAQAEVAASSLNVGAALAQQNAQIAKAKTEVTGLQVQASSVAKAEREIAKEASAAAVAVEKQVQVLNEAQTEYGQVQAAAAAARQAIAGNAEATGNAGSSAAKAAVQVATFAARLAVLAGAGAGKTSNPVVIDPAQVRAAEASLKELGVTIRAANNEATAAAVSGDELAVAMKGVGQARAQLEGIDKAISGQQAAVAGAMQAWKAAEAEVRRLALAIRDADQPSEELAAAFGRAQGAARLAKTEFQQQSVAAGKMAADLQAAGVGMGSLESAQAALAPRIQQANGLMGQASAAAGKMGAAVKQAGADADSAAPPVARLGTAIGQMAAGASRLAGATNPLRMFKNELVSMVAAAAGLYAVKEQLTAVWQAGVDLAANQSKFSTAFGSIEEGSKQLGYARDVALNLKLPISQLTKSYADLALAAKGTSLEGEGARKVFVAFAQVARVNQMSSESLGGTYTALTQIMSKGKVQAEELRQQLGDRLPGAMQLMAKGLGVTTEKLDQMMEKGELTREALLNMAAAASGQVAQALTQALNSPAAKLQDFQNRLQVFREQIAGSGFLDAVADAFERMAQALSTQEAGDAARAIGEGLADIVKWATELVSSGNLDTIVSWVQGLGAAWIALQITSIITGLYGFTTAIGATAIAVLGLDVALAPVLVGLAALAGVVATVVGAFALWKLAEWAYKNFPAFAEGVLKVKNAALTSWDAILQVWEMTGAKLKSSFTRITAQIADIWYGMMNKILGTFPELTKSLGLGDFAGEIAKRASDAAAQVASADAKMQAELDEIRARYAGKEGERQKQLQADIAGYYADRKKAEADAEKRTNLPLNGTKPTASSNNTGPGTERITADAYVPDDTKAKEKAAKKAAAERLALEKSVANQMYTIQSQLEKKSADNLDEKMDAVRSKYAKLYDQLRKLGKDETSQEWLKVDALVAQEMTNLRIADQKKQAAKAAKDERAATVAENKSRKDAMEYVNSLMQTRKNIQEGTKQAEARGDVEAAEKLKENLVTITAQANDAINGMLAFWGSVKGPDSDMAIAKLKAMQLELTKVKNTGILTGDNIAKAFGENLKNAGDGFIDKLAETGDIFGSLKESFQEFAASFLKQIAKMIIQQILFNALKAAAGSNPYFAVAAAAVGAASNHTGGVVGRDSGPRRNLPASVFQNAVRYHTGGVAGLKPNEVPTVLEAGEVVRTEQQEKALADKMAAAKNASAGGGGASPQIKIVNQIDSGDMVSAGLGSAAGEKAFINSISQNRDTIKRILG